MNEDEFDAKMAALVEELVLNCQGPFTAYYQEMCRLADATVASGVPERRVHLIVTDANMRINDRLVS